MVAEISFANAEIYKILCHNARCLISITNEKKKRLSNDESHS